MNIDKFNDESDDDNDDVSTDTTCRFSSITNVRKTKCQIQI